VAILAVATVASIALEATLLVTSTKPDPVLAATLAVVVATATVALAVAEAALEIPPATALPNAPKRDVFFFSGLGSSFGTTAS